MMSPAQKVSSAYQKTGTDNRVNKEDLFLFCFMNKDLLTFTTWIICEFVFIYLGCCVFIFLARYLDINIRGALSGVVVVQSHHPPGGLISTEASSVLLWK